MLTALLFAILLAVGAATAMHIAVDAKMQARPWRFLVPAIIAVVLTFFLQTSVDWLSQTLGKIDPGKDHLADLKIAFSLLNIVVGAFAGGMIGAAVSLRAQILNSKEQASLSALLAEITKRLEQAKTEEAAIKADQTLSEEERNRKVAKAQKLVMHHLMDLAEVNDDLKKISS